jgi:hypothetical protein
VGRVTSSAEGGLALALVRRTVAKAGTETKIGNRLPLHGAKVIDLAKY